MSRVWHVLYRVTRPRGASFSGQRNVEGESFDRASFIRKLTDELRQAGNHNAQVEILSVVELQKPA